MATHVAQTPIEATAWRIDPDRSSVEFEVPSFWGLITVRGEFDRYDGTLDLRRDPAVELTIDADSVNTRNKRRDNHLRSNAFFGAEANPRVRFESQVATLDGEGLTATGTLQAGGGSIPLRVLATVRQVESELEIEATAEIDQRELGMTLTVLGAVGTPSRLTVRGRLFADQG
jgi:polyisoprenoid-binding protein YceI